jgi:DNA/RNA endonuclease YhcR with UshA esterase domain
VSPVIAANVKRAVGTPAPAVRTAAQLTAINLPTSGDVGRLVVVRKARVGTFVSGNAPLTDATGTATVRIAVNTINTIGTARFAAGKCYDITGIVGLFNNAHQLQPRMASDVLEVSCN